VGGEPGVGEWARTVVRVATALRVRVGGVVAEVDLHGTDLVGAVVLVVSESDPLVETVRAGDRDGVPALIEAVDLCPVPVADRQRGRVELTGLIHEPPVELRRELALAAADRENIGRLLDIGYGHTVLIMDVADAALFDRAAGFVDAISGTDYADAAPDPLADVEGALLEHLLTDHPDELAQLANLLPPGLADRVTPIRLDRYGVVLRAGAEDVRLPFADPVGCVHQLPNRMRALLARARAAGRRFSDSVG
jgi:hypothetical protein